MQPSAAELAQLRRLARSQGITDFQVVVAHPPQPVTAIEVDTSSWAE